MYGKARCLIVSSKNNTDRESFLSSVPSAKSVVSIFEFWTFEFISDFVLRILTFLTRYGQVFEFIGFIAFTGLVNNLDKHPGLQGIDILVF